MEDFLSLLLGRHAYASPTDVLERLAPDIRKRVDVLRDIQTKHNDIKAEYFEKRAELEAEYQKLYQPLYKLRYYIVNDDVPEVDRVTKEVEESDKQADVAEGVPNFWLNALKTNKPLAAKIGDWDEGSLKYLTDIKCCRIDTPKAKGFNLDFYFHPNPYFKNAVLTKTYHYLIDDDEPIFKLHIITLNLFFFKKRAELEAEYQKMYEPLYKLRYDVVNAVSEVDGVTKQVEAAKEAEVEKGVPDFWLNAMKTNEVLTREITEKDEGPLKYLKDIKWCKIEEPKGFKLHFSFDTNPYFSNAVLTKTYHVIDDEEPILEKVIGTAIEWNCGKNLTEKPVGMKRKRGSNEGTIHVQYCKSFFNFFNSEYDYEVDEEAAKEIQEKMAQDYDIGSTIRDKIIPNAVSWFTGEATRLNIMNTMITNGDETSIKS
ncbi:hypothetical protein MKW98_008094 [Papaver atlanticum]|uniref:Nucleosome assembly protein 1 n=1 Tax=Papaver atlanticum TaxID=357466 RepID=A0AAD4S7M3_9MAGN|nr:hypothetical protein MKW98_008094 [Papaver atlanticum]